MSNPPPAPHQSATEALTPSAMAEVFHARHIRSLCDQFEAAWRGKQRPTIEEFLAQAAEAEREGFLSELISMEIELRRRAGEQPNLDEYRQRFADHAQVLESICLDTLASAGLANVQSSDSTQLENPPGTSTRPAETDGFIGRTIAARYEIHRRLGAGGMGTVYLAKQLPLDRWVALKLIRPDVASDPLSAKRFHREMRAAVRIQHPNTVRVYDYGTAESGELFLVMEYLNGLTLSSLLEDRQPLDPGRIDHIGFQVAKALAAAHTEGIIHRDLKPQNMILQDQYGDHDFVKVLDFGLARFTEQLTNDESLSITGDGSLLGTPQYMSPEQIEGEPVDPRTDLYALGVLLFRMATGQDLFSGKTIASLLAKHLHEPPRTPSSVTTNPIPKWLDRLILKLLEKDPSRRPQSADEVILLFDRSQQKVPVPADEAARLIALAQLHILDTDPEQAFDDLASLASYVCGTPIAAISLVDDDRQWFKSKVGLSNSETSRNAAFCAHAILGQELFTVSDATQDARFADSPLVQNNPNVRFYAGMPLATPDGHNIGTLCVMDRQPRQLSADQIAALTSLSRLVQSQFALRHALLPQAETTTAVQF